MNRRCRTASEVVAICVIGTLFLASCVHGGDAPYHYLGSVSAEQRWGNALIIDPVPAGTVTGIDPSDLLALCHTEATCGQGDDGPDISLGLITTPNSGEIGKDDNLVPDMSKTVGYELVWPHQGCMPRRVLTTVTTAEAQATGNSDCTRITVVNGLTGQYVLSVLL